MSSAKDALHVLTRLSRPTTNRVTDEFGFDRRWGGSSGWTPDSRYAPIHAGIDYSAEPDPVVFAPCRGLVYGHSPGGPVGTAIYIRPMIGADPLDNVILTLFHCTPTPAEWQEIEAGDELTMHAGNGIGEPHLHFEIDVAADVYDALATMGLIRTQEVRRTTVRGKAARRKLDADRVEKAVAEQAARWGIERLEMDTIIRAGLPEYRHSQYSRVGKERTAVINPGRFLA